MLRVWRCVGEVAAAPAERTKNTIALRSGENMWMNDGTLRVAGSTVQGRGVTDRRLHRIADRHHLGL